jgi:ribose transport system permease protein
MTRMRLASAIRTRSALPLLSLALLLLLIFALQPRAMTYRGLGLLLGFSAPVVLATLAQMFVMTVGDLDLSIGPFIGLVACIVATLPAISPLLTVAALVAGVLAYMAVGALISWRRLPALVVTLGLSFVWFGIAIIVRPNPGGEAPEWVENFINLQTPVAPIQLWIVCVVGLAGYFILQHSKQGLLLRAAGGGAVALQRAGWSVPRARVLAYGLAGVLGVLAGLALVGITTSADPDIATRYTLVSIAAVVLGGGEFSGGRVSVPGSIAGTYVMALADSLLAFMNVPADWQVAAQGLILLVVLALRAFLRSAP